MFFKPSLLELVGNRKCSLSVANGLELVGNRKCSLSVINSLELVGNRKCLLSVANGLAVGRQFNGLSSW